MSLPRLLIDPGDKGYVREATEQERRERGLPDRATVLEIHRLDGTVEVFHCEGPFMIRPRSQAEQVKQQPEPGTVVAQPEE